MSELTGRRYGDSKRKFGGKPYKLYYVATHKEEADLMKGRYKRNKLKVRVVPTVRRGKPKQWNIYGR